MQRLVVGWFADAASSWSVKTSFRGTVVVATRGSLPACCVVCRGGSTCMCQGIIALWKSVVITGKVEIGGAAAQMDLRGVTDKRML
jgi:hypothetical protein